LNDALAGFTVSVRVVGPGHFGANGNGLVRFGSFCGSSQGGRCQSFNSAGSTLWGWKRARGY